MDEIVIACDASCSKFAGTGYIIWGNESIGVRHKIISRRLTIEFNSTVMELMTVQEALKLPPEGSAIVVVNDCDVFRNINFHKQSGFINKFAKKSDALILLEEIYEFIKARKLRVRIVGKSSHPWHQMCHEGCKMFRDTLVRGKNMYELYVLDNNYEATLISRHFTKADADWAVKERFFLTKPAERARTIVALADNPKTRVKDLAGFTWKIKQNAS